MQEVSGVYASPFLDTDKLKLLYGPEKFPGLSRNGPGPGLKTKLLHGIASNPVRQLMTYYTT